ncbi:CynX/NimT family MFS transporter [Azospirillum agricola]|uniref:CynX/NimT family MFS transporter n=1 Tax=Azospirillum agricola TaxID=1720247 RepID=UPI000A0F35F9|nr:CynX/NimT family MFS transporter [Azospirillum agricola]SMH62617.1 MFS transporter, CP family, cyanate transporter [Azospirillum lipoferum]
MSIDSASGPSAAESRSGSPAAGRAARLSLGHPLLLAASLVLVALNLRPALSSLAPVMGDVVRDTGMSAGQAGLLTTSPVLCLGLFGVVAPRLAQRFGTERTIFFVLLMLGAGVALRGVGSFPALFAGATLAGAGIGIIGVLLPAVVKRDFPKKISLMMGVYTMALCAGAATAAGLTVPLERALGQWTGALAFWALPAVVAAVAWLPQMRGRPSDAGQGGASVRGLWRNGLAWQITLFMGLQSSLAYIVLGWMAPMLRDRGLDPAMAGLVVSGSVMTQVVSALFAPMLATRTPGQSLAAAAMLGCSLVGMIGCLYAPLATIGLWAVILGIGQGGVFAVALTLIVLRSPDSRVAAHLSGMSQSVGYTLASTGPFAVGLLHGWSGDWHGSALLFVVVAVLATVFGILAGRPRQIRL